MNMPTLGHSLLVLCFIFFSVQPHPRLEECGGWNHSGLRTVIPSLGPGASSVFLKAGAQNITGILLLYSRMASLLELARVVSGIVIVLLRSICWD